MFKNFLVRKEVEPIDVPFFCYNNEEDSKIHQPILARGESQEYKDLTIARLRARTGLDAEGIARLVE